MTITKIKNFDALVCWDITVWVPGRHFSSGVTYTFIRFWNFKPEVNFVHRQHQLSFFKSIVVLSTIKKAV